jgi:hypothetical protein
MSLTGLTVGRPAYLGWPYRTCSTTRTNGRIRILRE